MVTKRQIAYSRAAMRLLGAVGVAALMAGCSDASRFADPFSDPFAGSTPKSVASRSIDRAPTGGVSAPRSAAPARVETSSLPAPSASSPRAASSAPAPAPAPAQQASSGSSHWTADGGTPIVVAQGETASMLATRYGVPTDALLRANGFSSSAQVQPGVRLLIPVYRSGAGSAVAAARPAAAPAPVAAKPAAPKVAETKPESKTDPAKPLAAAKPEPKTPAPKLAKTEKVDAKPQAKPVETKPVAEKKPVKAEAKTEKKLIEAARAEAKPVKTERIARAESAPEPAAKTEKREPAKAAAAEKPAEAAPAKPAAKSVDSSPTASIPATEKAVATDDSRPEFRWPARGRIIQGFSSGGNDGINIAVPEGTQVKAAESGVVAYAGSELKGYGNLVLIRHPNGFVSAYAHNGELEVKRGDQVKRGQTIAKSGQSGNVGSPQLHFELRKGSTPVDPTNYLAGI
jgi:murein DD-endopeptidase MepM/ murein hydrolase activator NlpD